jgi:F-type H+-transporting ATPase subunit delta
MAEKATIARPYAKAAFESARSHKAFDRWSTVLATASSVVQDERVARLLSSPLVLPAQLSDLIGEIVGKDLDEQSRNFLATLAGNRRLALLPEIATMFEALRAEAENTADVQVISAVQLNDAQKQRLSAALKKRLKREVRLHVEVDESLIGGAIVRAGDFVIDGSLKARLDRMAVEMAH